MLGAVVANAEAASDDAVAPLRRDLRGVQVELRELTTVISELQDELAAAGKPRSRSKTPDESPAEAKTTVTRPRAVKKAQTPASARTPKKSPKHQG